VELDGYVRLKIRHTAMERTKEELFQVQIVSAKLDSIGAVFPNQHSCS
jgi:hypothetical protein